MEDMVRYMKILKKVRDKAMSEDGVIDINVTYDGNIYALLRSEKFDEMAQGHNVKYMYYGGEYFPHSLSFEIGGVIFKASYSDSELLARYGVEARTEAMAV